MTKEEFIEKYGCIIRMTVPILFPEFEQDVKSMLVTESDNAVTRAINSISFDIDQRDTTVSHKPTRKDYGLDDD